MQVGTVFLWLDFPYQINGEVKSRLFIYLGKSHFSIKPQFAYLFTTTTKFKHYRKNGYRKNNSFTIFEKGEYCFDERCILDLDSGLHEIDISLLENNKKIIIKDALSNNKLKEIYSLILLRKLKIFYGYFIIIPLTSD